MDMNCEYCTGDYDRHSGKHNLFCIGQEMNYVSSEKRLNGAPVKGLFYVKFCPMCGNSLESPETLTPKQVRSWTMGEPLFIKLLPPCYAECWEIPLKIVPGMERLLCKGSNVYFMEDYGKTWTAYTHKPRQER